MTLLLHFFFGLSTSFLGMVTPSMLNMTAARISIQKNRKEATKFALGVSLVVFAQAYLAVLFTRYLSENPSFIETLRKIAAVIFLLLSIYFYRQFKKDKIREETKETSIENSFRTGLVLSLLNMFAIPFYCWVSSVLGVAGYLQFSQIYILFFVTGSTVGTFLLLYTYSKYAKKIKFSQKTRSNNINLVLSVITGLVGMVTIFQLF